MGCFPNPHYPVPKSLPSLLLNNPDCQEDGVESWTPEGSLYELLEQTSPVSFLVPCTIRMGCLVDLESGVNHPWGRADSILNYHLLKEVRQPPVCSPTRSESSSLRRYLGVTSSTIPI